MVVMTSLIYPVVVHWTWGGGWLSDGDDGMYTDFAGSGIVHLCGAVAALCGAAIIGPRAGRWSDEWDAEPHSIPLVVLGTFILWFGWYGFNAGSTVSMTGDGSANANTAALVAMTTTLAAGTGGITTFYIRLAMTKQYDIGGLTNGILAGLVSITAGCDGVYGWAAIVIGFIGGFVYCASSALMVKLKIDDPLDAFSVHGACGTWGVIAVALFNVDKGIFYGGPRLFGDNGDGNHGGKQLGWQIAGIITIAVWTAGLSAPSFFALKQAGLLRVSEDTEKEGGDVHCLSPRNSKKQTEA
jgi:Amt family ammonium transporter